MTKSIEWAAGLFEGEGSIVCTKLKNRANSYKVATVLSMTDLDVVESFRDSVGFGSIKGPYKSSYSTGKPRFIWEVQNFRECKKLLEMFLPYFGQRRRQKAEETLALINSRIL